MCEEYIGRHYVPFINNKYDTSGTIWEGRFKASLVDNEQYLFTCMRYIELNPVRENMTRVPATYPWSSYRANAQGEMDQRITPHPLYTSLGETQHERLNAYQGLFRKQMNQGELTIIRNAWQTGAPLGNDSFKQKIESKLNCKVGQDRDALKGFRPLKYA